MIKKSSKCSYFKTFQVYSSYWWIKLNGLNLVIFQNFSSLQFINFCLKKVFSIINISKLFKFTVHTPLFLHKKLLWTFQNFSSLQFIDVELMQYTELKEFQNFSSLQFIRSRGAYSPILLRFQNFSSLQFIPHLCLCLISNFYFKTFQVYSSYRNYLNICTSLEDFKTFQVYSSLKYVGAYKYLYLFQNFSSLQFISINFIISFFFI